MCGRWLVAARTSSWWATSIRVTSAPQASHMAVTRSTARGSVSANGVRMTRRPWYNSAKEASTPLRSVPAMGCPGTSLGGTWPKAARASNTTLPFTLPPSVTTASGAKASRMAPKTWPMVPRGTATKTRSAPATACAGSWLQRSTTPNSTARSRLAAERPQPTTSPTTPAARRARARDPPMSPTPMTARRRIMPPPAPAPGRRGSGRSPSEARWSPAGGWGARSWPRVW